MNENRLKVVFKNDPDSSTVFEGDLEEVTSWISERSNPQGYLIYNNLVYSDDNGTYMTVLDFFRAKWGITEPFVPKYYQMNRTTEDLLPNGLHLANGMEILLDDSNERARVEQGDRDWMVDRLEERNLWCKVTNLECVLGSDTVSFVGVYSHGAKRKRTVPMSYAWLVKVDSIDESFNQVTARSHAVSEIIRDAMIKRDKATCMPCYEKGGFTLDDAVQETMTKLIGLI